MFRPVGTKGVIVKYRFALVVMVTMFVVAGFAWSADDSDTRPAPSKAQGSVQPSKSVNKSEDNSEASEDIQRSSEVSPKVTQVVSVPNPTDPPDPEKNVHNKVKAPGNPAPRAPQPPPQQQPRGEPRGHNDWPSGWNDHPHSGHHHCRHDWHGNPWRSWHPHHNWYFWMGPVFVPYPVYVREPVYSRRHGRGVYVRYHGDDALGADIARSLRGQLSDHGLRTVYSADEARLEFYIVSMDLNAGDPGQATAVSVTYIWMPGNRFITTQLLDVPSSDVDDVADYLAGRARDMIDEYR